MEGVLLGCCNILGGSLFISCCGGYLEVDIFDGDTQYYFCWNIFGDSHILGRSTIIAIAGVE